MPKQRIPGRSNKRVRIAKLLITAFAITATMAGCAALNTQLQTNAIFTPAIVVDIDDLPTPSSVDPLRLRVTNHLSPDEGDAPAQQSGHSPSQIR
jgi:hypothetical protein